MNTRRKLIEEIVWLQEQCALWHAVMWKCVSQANAVYYQQQCAELNAEMRAKMEELLYRHHPAHVRLAGDPMSVTVTNRGFKKVEFTDRYGNDCSLQESSLADEACVWFGCDEIGLKKFVPYFGWSDVPLQQDDPHGITHIANTRMHLTQAQVAQLLPYLEHFAETGELPRQNEVYWPEREEG